MVLAVWLRAEAVRDIVVLRAHTLASAVHAAVVELGVATGSTVWLVWHRPEPPPPVASSPLVTWPHAAAILRGPGSRPVLADGAIAEVYGRTRDRARQVARAWATRSAPVASRFVAPGAPLSVVLQRLTIDARSHAELLVRLHAVQSGFREQGLALALPAIVDENRLAGLGPRLDADTLRRLRRIACPTTAGALLLALATDVDSQQLASASAFRTCATDRHIRFLAGTYRIPPHARPLLRAAVLTADQPNTLLTDRHSRLFLARRMANLIQRAADRVGVPAPAAARPSSPWDRAQPYAPAFTTTASVTPAS